MGIASFPLVLPYLVANLGTVETFSGTPDRPPLISAHQVGGNGSETTESSSVAAGRGPNAWPMGKQPFDVMGFMQGLVKRIPSSPNLPSLDDSKSEKAAALPGLSFFRRRIRLKGNSSISIPLGFVLLFPCIVVLLILIIVVQHPSSPGRILMPAGSPPSIRCENERAHCWRLANGWCAGKSAKSTTVSLKQDA